MISLQVVHRGTAFFPSVEDGITLETERAGSPGKLSFTVISDGSQFEEGDCVAVYADWVPMFKGFVFSKKRDRDGRVKVVAYDQLRYLKNRWEYVYEGKTAADVVAMIAADFGLQVGTLADTGYVIPSRDSNNGTLFDTVQTAIDETLLHTGKLYVLYDDFGKLCLKSDEDLMTDYLVLPESAENFDYASSIDGETYNYIVLVTDGAVPPEEAYDHETIAKWGVLRKYEKVDDWAQVQQQAKQMLELYNRPTRTLQVKGCFGDPRVRGGSSVLVKLDLGDVQLSQYMMVEKVKHSFKNGLHQMDMTLKGGVING